MVPGTQAVYQTNYVPWSPALVVEKTPTNLAPSYAEKLNAGYAQLASLLSSL